MHDVEKLYEAQSLFERVWAMWFILCVCYKTFLALFNLRTEKKYIEALPHE